MSARSFAEAERANEYGGIINQLRAEVKALREANSTFADQAIQKPDCRVCRYSVINDTPFEHYCIFAHPCINGSQFDTYRNEFKPLWRTE